MADDKTNVGKPDCGRVNVNEDYELRDWSQKLGVAPEALKEGSVSSLTAAVQVMQEVAIRRA